jgi:beta-glucosidase
LLTQADLDRALRRLFTARFRLGMFDPPSLVPYSKIAFEENDSDAHRQLALQTARESLVLLKNQNHLLPLTKPYSTIAVIGPDADNLDALVGNYNGTPSRPVTILDGIRRRFSQSKVIYAEGTGLTGPVMHAIPSEALFTDDSRQEHGLRGEYFANVDLKDAPVLTRTDATVNFAWGDQGISPQLLKNYSVRWTGVLVPPETGDYLIGFTGQDGFRLWVDDNLIAEEWTIHHPADTLTKPMHLDHGHAYRIKIEYFQTIRSAEARLVWSMPGQDGKDAVDAAREADLVIMVLGLSPRIEGEEMNVHTEGFAGGDRTSLDLPAPQEKLLERVHALGKPIILVLTSGSAVAVNWADHYVPAILEAWYPGGEGGTAVAEAIAGDFSPSGRLPVTFYKSALQLPPFEDYSMANRTYRYFTGDPLYPFGYGLSYTTFAYRNLQVDNQNVRADGSVTISVDVANTGRTAGDEVAQLYLTHNGIAGAPLRALQGFQRVHLNPGEQKRISFTLHDRDLSVVDQNGKWRISPGKVSAWVGGGQPPAAQRERAAAGARTEFTITGEALLPD